MKRNKIFALGIASSLLALSAGCASSGGSKGASGSGAAGSSSAKSTKSLQIAYANITSANPTLKGIADLIQQAATTSGDTVSLFDNQADPTTAVSVAQLMVNSKPDVIMDWPPAPQIGASLSAIFKRGNVPCISVNISIPDCPWFNLDNATLGTLAGQELAKLMQAKGWDGTNTTFVMAQNATVGDDNNALERSGYIAVANALPGFTKMTLSQITATTTTISASAVQVDAGDQVDTAYTAMQNALQSIPKNRHIVVYGITDESVIGAARAISGAGRTDVMLAGNGGGASGLQQLRTNPEWVVDSSSFVPQWGEYLMAMAHALTSGVTLPAKTKAPIAIVTKANVNQYYKPNSADVLKMPPLDPADQYLVATGILQKYDNIQGLS